MKDRTEQRTDYKKKWVSKSVRNYFTHHPSANVMLLHIKVLQAAELAPFSGEAGMDRPQRDISVTLPVSKIQLISRCFSSSFKILGLI